MGIQGEYSRDKDIMDYTRGKEVMKKGLSNITSLLAAAVAFKTKYPDDATEVDQDIAWVTGKCQEIISNY